MNRLLFPKLSLTSVAEETVWRWGLRSAGLLSLFLLWEWFGRTHRSLMLAPFSDVPPALIEQLGNPELYEALWISNQAMLIGYALAVLLAVPLGILLARVSWLERVTDSYLTILIVTPMSAMIPIIIVAVGLGLSARVIVVFLFSFPIIVLNTRTGLKNLDSSLVEMANSLKASEFQLWRYILLPSALPGIFAGLQLGLARALSGMVIVELILIAAGIGKLILHSMAMFEPATTYALALIIIVEIMVLMMLFRWFRDRCLAWQRTA